MTVAVLDFYLPINGGRDIKKKFLGFSVGVFTVSIFLLVDGDGAVLCP